MTKTIQEPVLLSKDHLEEFLSSLSKNELASMAIEDIYCLVTKSQFVTDSCIAELERRNVLAVFQDPDTGEIYQTIPYCSDHRAENLPTSEQDTGKDAAAIHRGWVDGLGRDSPSFPNEPIQRLKKKFH